MKQDNGSIFNYLAKFFESHNLATAKTQSLLKDPFIRNRRQTQQLVQLLIFFEVEPPLLVDEHVVGLFQRVEVVELVEVYKLVKLLGTDAAYLLVSFFYQAHLQLPSEHLPHHAPQLATVHHCRTL